MKARTDFRQKVLEVRWGNKFFFFFFWVLLGKSFHHNAKSYALILVTYKHHASVESIHRLYLENVEHTKIVITAYAKVGLVVLFIWFLVYLL